MSTVQPALALIPEGFESIHGEKAVPVERMPGAWPAFARGEAICLHPQPDTLSDFLRLFYTKMADQGLEKIACEAVKFYGQDWQAPAYPDFAAMRAAVAEAADPQDPAIRLQRHVLALFDRFGHRMPASFYVAHLLPLQRASLHEIRYLRFSPADAHHVRATDAVLHAQNVFGVHDEIQSRASEEGFRWDHGCDCKHSLSQLGETPERFFYRIPEDGFDEAVRSYLWRMWHEFALFALTVTTRYVMRGPRSA